MDGLTRERVEDCVARDCGSSQEVVMNPVLKLDLFKSK
jgi:hypothetical protein